jgi:hypothetical protein
MLASACLTGASDRPRLIPITGHAWSHVTPRTGPTLGQRQLGKRQPSLYACPPGCLRMRVSPPRPDQQKERSGHEIPVFVHRWPHLPCHRPDRGIRSCVFHASQRRDADPLSDPRGGAMAARPPGHQPTHQVAHARFGEGRRGTCGRPWPGGRAGLASQRVDGTSIRVSLSPMAMAPRRGLLQP